MFLVTKAVLPGMLAAGGGSVICTSSISAVVGTPMEVLYCTTKGACHMFARALAVEYRDQNIRSNAICPGFIGTAHGRRELDLLRGFGVDASDEAIKTMQGRLCDPAEVITPRCSWPVTSRASSAARTCSSTTPTPPCNARPAVPCRHQQNNTQHPSILPQSQFQQDRGSRWKT